MAQAKGNLKSISAKDVQNRIYQDCSRSQAQGFTPNRTYDTFYWCIDSSSFVSSVLDIPERPKSIDTYNEWIRIDPLHFGCSSFLEDQGYSGIIYNPFANSSASFNSWDRVSNCWNKASVRIQEIFISQDDRISGSHRSEV